MPVNKKDSTERSDDHGADSWASPDLLEPLCADTFARRLNSLSQAVNTMDEFRQALVSQHPRYAKRLPDIP